MSQAMGRVLVLGGGGVVGIAWETGVCAALLEAGVELQRVDSVVGTSAGAVVGCRMLEGRPLSVDATGSERSKPQLGAGDPTRAARIFNLWSQMDYATPTALGEIGALACETFPDPEAERRFVAHMEKIDVEEWPQIPLRITAVDAESGERRFFDRDSGVLVKRAIAASVAVPGMFPPVTIQGRRYMDGQTHSSTHADALLQGRAPPSQAVVVMPTNRFTGDRIGRHAERAFARERAELEAAGVAVVLCTPRERDASELGEHLMDRRHMPSAYAAGLARGRALANELGSPPGGD